MEIDSHVLRCTTKSICYHLSKIASVVSITFVGSFIDSKATTSISDIDIVVIVNKITEEVFREIEIRAEKICGDECGLPGYKTRLNMTFGPLKFNDKNTIVFHLMVYDVEGHRYHVDTSPFTCYDWQRHNPVYGRRLNEIYTAAPLQFSDMLSSRRSLSSYISDLNSNSITYRKYSFNGDTAKQEKYKYLVDRRHQYEYAYHITRYLLLNLLKILEQNNVRLNDKQLADKFVPIWDSGEDNIAFYLELARWKRKNAKKPLDIELRLNKFLTELHDLIHQLNAKATTVTFIRHAKTLNNDGSFLGVRRDPSIIESSTFKRTMAFDLIYTSKMKRAIETGKLFDTKKLEQNILLNEIDYGLAEGMTFLTYKEKYPDIVQDWLSGVDTPFPEGECQQNVAFRLDEFIRTIILPHSGKYQHIGVVTHNVVIRALLGRLFNIPVNLWHKFQLGHLEEFPCLIIKGKLIPALLSEQRQRLRKMITNCDTTIA